MSNQEIHHVLCWWLKLSIFTEAIFQASSITCCKMIPSCCLAQRSKSVAWGEEGMYFKLKSFCWAALQCQHTGKEIENREECDKPEVMWKYRELGDREGSVNMALPPEKLWCGPMLSLPNRSRSIKQGNHLANDLGRAQCHRFIGLKARRDFC